MKPLWSTTAFCKRVKVSNHLLNSMLIRSQRRFKLWSQKHIERQKLMSLETHCKELPSTLNNKTNQRSQVMISLFNSVLTSSQRRSTLLSQRRTEPSLTWMITSLTLENKDLLSIPNLILMSISMQTSHQRKSKLWSQKLTEPSLTWMITSSTLVNKDLLTTCSLIQMPSQRR